MKKIILATAMLSLSFGFLGSCSKAADVVANNCEANAQKVTDAGNAFFADPTNKTKCQAYIAAINDMYKSCPAYYPAGTKKALDDALANACK
jgi:hypothetical protein